MSPEEKIQISPTSGTRPRKPLKPACTIPFVGSNMLLFYNFNSSVFCSTFIGSIGRNWCSRADSICSQLCCLYIIFSNQFIHNRIGTFQGKFKILIKISHVIRMSYNYIFLIRMSIQELSNIF